MADPQLSDIADKFAEIDIAMLSTLTDGGGIATRPMSNNGQVEYQGDSYYFTLEDTRTVGDIRVNPRVSLGFAGDGFWATAAGKAELIYDKAAFEEHWTPNIDKWFEDGVDTEGLVLLKVRAERIRFWDGADEGDIVM